MATQVQNIKGRQTLDSLFQLYERFQIVNMSQEFVDEATELLISSTLKLSPVYKLLEIERKTIEKSFRKCVEDQRNWGLSFVVLDKQNNNKIAGIKIVTDMAQIDKELRPTGCPKKDFKEQIDQELIQEQYDKNYKEGECAYILAYNIAQEYQGTGLAVLMIVEFTARVIMAGYKFVVNIIYNKTSMVISQKYFGGQITKQIDLSQKQLNGNYVFKNVKGLEYAYLQYNDLRNDAEVDKFLGVRQLITAKTAALKQLQRQQQRIQIQNEIQPKL